MQKWCLVLAYRSDMLFSLKDIKTDNNGTNKSGSISSLPKPIRLLTHYLTFADLRNAKRTDAFLPGADLINAGVSNAKLTHAFLPDAD